MTEPELSFQHYNVLRAADGSPFELGRGSMGITYKAFDVNLCCEVALKVINSASLDHPHARERFVSEARAAARLRHRNIANVFHLGNDGEHYFYAMEFVDGETLDALVRREGPLPVEVALPIVLQATRALASAARQGLVHRDLKPANIMVTHEDDDDHLLVKIIDFGLAKPVAHTDGSRPLTFGGFVGTPQFASPEQLQEKAVDGRSDIYSLGATAWFLLTGRAPFLGSLAAICQQHLTQPPPWSQLPKPFPETVRTLLARMLEKDPGRRPQDAVELRRLIEASLEVVREQPAAGKTAERLGAVRAARPPWFRPRDEGQPGKTTPLADGELPRTGMILKGRYELLRLVGEGNSGRVFLARDRSADEALVAVKVLHAELVAVEADRARLTADLRRIQDAAHPQLIRLTALETLLSRDSVFLVEEWLHGFTLLEFLAVRGGSLSLGETLRLLEQAAAAADYAEHHGLERLDFALHQFHVHFPSAGRKGDDPEAARSRLQIPMAQWPAWSLKLNPLGALRKGLEASTWAGDVTLVTGHSVAGLAKHTLGDDARPDLRELYIHGTAQVTYELLGGAPAAAAFGGTARARHASLPALNEEGNAVLHRALADPASFGGAQEFYDALAHAAGSSSEGVALVLPAVFTEPVPAPAVIAPAPVESAPNRSGSTTPPPSTDLSTSETTPPRPASRDHTPRWRSRSGTAREPVRRVEAVPPVEDVQPEETGGAWERLTLVSGERATSALWVGGLVLTFVVLLVAAICFLVALERRPTRKRPPGSNATAQSARSAKRSTPPPAVSRPAATPPPPAIPASTPESQPKNPPTIDGLAAATVPLAPTSSPEPTPVRVPEVRPEPTPPPEVETTPPPLGLEPRAGLVRVHVESKPSGVEVYSRGKLLGRTPLDTSLPLGSHQLVGRYKDWPEIRQTLRLEGTQAAASAELRMMPPSLVPTAHATATPVSRNRRAQQEAEARRNFVRSTRRDVPTALPVPSPAADPGNHEVRRALPTLHPFDPDGTFQSRTRSDEGVPQAEPVGD